MMFKGLIEVFSRSLKAIRPPQGLEKAFSVVLKGLPILFHGLLRTFKRHFEGVLMAFRVLLARPLARSLTNLSVIRRHVRAR